MALWEYKVITSGKGGFATPALLESYLNQLGKEEWEIVEFRTQPDNVLAFNGIARRPTQRDWTLEAAAAAAAKVEADKLRAGFPAKYQPAATGTAPASDTPADSEAVNRDDSFRRPLDTEHDQDPYALDDSSTEEEEIPDDEQLPTFFEAVRPHMRRNQRGPGYAVGIDFLVKRFDLLEEDLLGALKDCGFPIPEDEDDKPFYIEYDGDLYWLNTNRRGELWLNTREKPRPVFKSVKGTPISTEVVEEAISEEAKAAADERATRNDDRRNRGDRHDRGDRRDDRRNRRGRDDRGGEAPQADKPAAEIFTPTAAAAPSEAPATTEGAPAATEASAPAAPAPAATPAPAPAPAVVITIPPGNELLEKLRPLMRRSRGGLSGTISFLARAMHQSEADLLAALGEIGLRVSASNGEKAPMIESDGLVYWLNRDGRGGVWINVRERREPRENKPAASAEASAPVSAPGESAQPAAEASAPTEAPAARESFVPTKPAEAPAAEAAPVGPVAEVIAFPKDGDPASASIIDPVPTSSEALPELPDLSKLPGPLAAVRLFLKSTKTGSFAATVEGLAATLGKGEGEFVATLVELGLKVPEKAREKPVFIEHAGEIYWFNKNAKGELWLNAKASKFAGEKEAKDDAAKSRRPRRPRKSTE